MGLDPRKKRVEMKKRRRKDYKLLRSNVFGSRGVISVYNKKEERKKDS